MLYLLVAALNHCLDRWLPKKRETGTTKLAASVSPYGWSKLMTEILLGDAGTAHNLRHVILRYFNVAGADPHGRTGQSTKNAPT
jgi:UDP-glucose 4-epimerase